MRVANEDFVQPGETYLLAFLRHNRPLFGPFIKAEIVPYVGREGRGRQLHLVDDGGKLLVLPDPTNSELEIVLGGVGLSLQDDPEYEFAPDSESLKIIHFVLFSREGELNDGLPATIVVLPEDKHRVFASGISGAYVQLVGGQRGHYVWEELIHDGCDPRWAAGQSFGSEEGVWEDVTRIATQGAGLGLRVITGRRAGPDDRHEIGIFIPADADPALVAKMQHDWNTLVAAAVQG